MGENREQKTFHTNLDYDLQTAVSKIAKRQGKTLAAAGIHNLSVVVIDNKAMHTVAYIGNQTTAENPLQYGAAVDIAQKPRSTGSVLKPFLYALMLDSGEILPDTLIPDIPSSFQGFSPENYDREYRGAVPAREALSRSLNIPSVRMLRQYGVERFQDDLIALGMSTLFRNPDEYGLSLILGGAEGTLFELTGIYAKLLKLARDGNRENLNYENRVLLEENKKSEGQGVSVSQGAAWLTLEALKEVVRPGHEKFWREFSDSQTVAWKTGTSYGLRDAWAIGSSGHYTVGVWSGNAGGEGVANLSGLNSAAPTLFDVFNVLGYSHWPDKPEVSLRELKTCEQDGFLANGNCKNRISLAPVDSHFEKVSPFYQTVPLSEDGLHRVHGNCERVSNMHQKNWFVLPPVQEFYWIKHHSEYQSIPPWRKDCVPSLANYSDDAPMEIMYPLEGSKVYIPNELDGQKGKVIFRASHRNQSARVFWHIDDEYIDETQLYHDMAVDVPAGWHKLILVDNLGFRLERWFRVLE